MPPLDTLELNGFLHRVEICLICGVTSPVLSISISVRIYWRILLQLSAKFEFGAKTENPILTLKKASESEKT